MTEANDDPAERERVYARIAPLILSFRSARIGRTFHAEELRTFVRAGAPEIAPASPDRILRQLRWEGRLEYQVVNRRASLYLFPEPEPEPVPATAPHPATWSAPILEVIAARLPKGATVLDPFAGTARSDVIPHAYTVGIEIEPEWAAGVVGNALSLPFRAGTFLWVATSPCFGNRMADHHDNRDPCKPCSGTGLLPQDDLYAACRACGGSGLSRRHTYKHYLGRDPHPASSAILQWGGEYRSFHLAAWAEMTRVCGRWAHLLLDISDHIRGGAVMPVTDWHQSALEGLGWLCLDRIPVDVRRQRHGQNGDLRVLCEWVLEFVRVG